MSESNATLSLPFTTLDVFTTRPFHGNQLAIVHLAHPLLQAKKQSIAREFNFSETVFIQDALPTHNIPPSGHSTTTITTTSPPIQTHHLQTFTTTEELPFAGHPTIGTIHYLCSRVEPPLAKVNLCTKVGTILGSYDSGRGRAEADLPHNVHVHAALLPISAILSSQAALAEHSTPFPDAPVVSLVKGLSFALIDLTSHPPALSDLKGSGQRIEEGAVKMDEGWAPSFVGLYYFVVAARNGNAYKIKARMIEESIGEDAATGSAASCLAAHLALRDGEGSGKYEFTVEQGVEFGRASEIAVAVELGEDGKVVDSVTLGGSAVVVTEGTIHVPECSFELMNAT